jgi:hypothetical protein
VGEQVVSIFLQGGFRPLLCPAPVEFVRSLKRYTGSEDNVDYQLMAADVLLKKLKAESFNFHRIAFPQGQLLINIKLSCNASVCKTRVYARVHTCDEQSVFDFYAPLLFLDTRRFVPLGRYFVPSPSFGERCF